MDMNGRLRDVEARVATHDARIDSQETSLRDMLQAQREDAKEVKGLFRRQFEVLDETNRRLGDLPCGIHHERLTAFSKAVTILGDEVRTSRKWLLYSFLGAIVLLSMGATVKFIWS